MNFRVLHKKNLIFPILLICCSHINVQAVTSNVDRDAPLGPQGLTTLKQDSKNESVTSTTPDDAPISSMYSPTNVDDRDIATELAIGHNIRQQRQTK